MLWPEDRLRRVESRMAALEREMTDNLSAMNDLVTAMANVFKHIEAKIDAIEGKKKREPRQMTPMERALARQRAAEKTRNTDKVAHLDDWRIK